MNEHPEDEQRPEDEEVQPAQEQVADEEPAEEAQAPAEPPAEEPAPPAEAEEPVAEAPEEPEPAPAAEAEPPEAPEEPEPAPAAAEAEPAPEEPEPAPAAEAEPAPEQPTAEAPQPAPAAAEAADEVEAEEIEEAPRVRPEIPGADLIPDIVPVDEDEFLDAEARAAAEAEAEAAAAHEEESEDESRPIADAAIDLAAGARYTATGKRKSAVARVILKPGSGSYVINGKELDTFFPRETLQRIIRQPLETVGYESRMDVVARMHGGGVSAQAGALRHGISRALLVADPNLRSELKRRGFLTRDPRVKERKKAGLKKARKRPQFSKR